MRIPVRISRHGKLEELKTLISPRVAFFFSKDSRHTGGNLYNNRACRVQIGDDTTVHAEVGSGRFTEEVFVERTGRVESASGWGARKKNVRMIREGSMLFAAEAPKGSARDVSPEGFPHPVYQSGLALSIPLPWTVSV